MIKKLWHKWFGENSKIASIKTPILREEILTRDQHRVSRRDISPNALKVLSRLHNANYEAYLVGGGVRDILLGLHPKDFDVATSATPEQIKRLFRNCRIIGRRFKLAHILFGPEIIEVATFRAHHSDDTQHGKQHESGMLVRDNVYGSLLEDAQRRDFTINALYYSSKDFTVRDFTEGLHDLQLRQLRLIGDPLTRYKEDPVRMLRAVRLSAKLNLAIEKNTAAPIYPNANLLNQVSSARLWDESHKLFLAGKARVTFECMREYGLFKELFPATQKSLDNDLKGEFIQFIHAAMSSTDSRILEDKPVTPAFLYAVLLWQPLMDRITECHQQGTSHNDAFHRAMSIVIEEQCQYIAIPRRFSLVMRDIWSLQQRLEHRSNKSYKLIEHPKFRAAYDFLVLRSTHDVHLTELAQWWTEFQNANSEQQRTMTQSQAKPKRKRQRKSNFRNKNQATRRRAQGQQNAS